MRFTKLSLFIAGAVGILMLAVPRAAHAVVAALVQVTNTASSPVIAQGIGDQAAQIVQIECGFRPFPQTYERCVLVPATGIFPPPNNSYTVPDGQTLVVTSVDILSASAPASPSPCASPTFAWVDEALTAGNTITVGIIRKSWLVPAGAGSVHYAYPSGILFSSGTTIQDVGPNVNSPCFLTLDMHGYLTAQ
jgi:hypothetical protein